MNQSKTVWVFAKPEDPGLVHLETPDGVRFVISEDLAVLSRAPRPDGILICGPYRDLLKAVLPMVPDLAWIHVRSAGVESVVFPELARPGLVITNGRGVFSGALAEFAVGALLFFAKEFRRLVRQQEAGVWEQFSPLTLAGRRLAIVGFGDIGRTVALRARAMGMSVAALRRRPGSPCEDALADEVFAPERLLDLLAQADDVVFAMPITAETRGMIGRVELAVLRPGCVLVNIGRGGVIQEGPLVEALRERRIRGAALDVFETEPLPPGHPFYSLDNVLLSPHCADRVPDSVSRSMACFRSNLASFLAGQPFKGSVDPTRGY